jgi:hypothetical protein
MAPRAGPLVAACWAKKRHVLEKPWCKDIKTPLEFDEATVVVHQSPSEEICKGKQDDGVGVDMPRQWLRSYALHWQDAHPVALGCNSRATALLKPRPTLGSDTRVLAMSAYVLPGPCNNFEPGDECLNIGTDYGSA